MSQKRTKPPKRAEGDTTVTIQIPLVLKETIQKLAKVEERSMSAWMRYYLAEKAAAKSAGTQGKP